MFSQINVDVCKTPDCKNLGVFNSPDYLAQGKNILCRECGFFSLSFLSALLTFFVSR